ncbi:MAG: hypothetical protein ACYDHP_13520 [Ferrimicrobium sp.]
MGKTGQRVGAGIATLVLLGGAGAFYVASSPTLEHKLLTGHAPVKPLPFGAIKVGGKVIPLADQTVGWNTAKTRYVFPEGAGLLPASEVKLAHEDPAYMAALTAAAVKPVRPSYAGAPGGVGWYDQGGAQVFLSGSGSSEIANLKMFIGSSDSSWGGPPADLKIVNSHVWPISTKMISSSVALPGNGWEVAGSYDAAMAAPFGTVVVHGQTLNAYCVPHQTASWQNGAWLHDYGTQAGPSGPATVFASSNNGSRVYQYGIASCKSFG